MSVPRWLQWLLPLEPNRPSRLDVLDGVAPPEAVLLTEEVTEEEAIAVAKRLAKHSDDIVADFAEAFANISAAISAVRLREFVEALPTPEPFDGAPAWHPTSHRMEKS